MAVVVDVAGFKRATKQTTVLCLRQVSRREHAALVAGVEVDLPGVGLRTAHLKRIISSRGCKAVTASRVMKSCNSAPEGFVGGARQVNPWRRREPRGIAQVNVNQTVAHLGVISRRPSGRTNGQIDDAVVVKVAKVHTRTVMRTVRSAGVNHVGEVGQARR